MNGLCYIVSKFVLSSYGIQQVNGATSVRSTQISAVYCIFGIYDVETKAVNEQKYILPLVCKNTTVDEFFGCILFFSGRNIGFINY